MQRGRKTHNPAAHNGDVDLLAIVKRRMERWRVDGALPDRLGK